MAQMTKSEFALVKAGYVGGDCPGMWSSRNWEFWAFGQWLASKGMSLGPAPHYWHKLRGRKFENPSGFTYQITATQAPDYIVERIS